MPEAPKVIEAKLTRIAEQWELHAKDHSFGEMTLTEFKEAIKPSMDSRAKLIELGSKTEAEATARDTADVESLKAADAVVRGLVGDKAFGPDSALYEALGYVRKSERKSGLTRKKKDAPKP